MERNEKTVKWNLFDTTALRVISIPQMHDLTPNERCVLKDRIWPYVSLMNPTSLAGFSNTPLFCKVLYCTVYMKEAVQKNESD